MTRKQRSSRHPQYRGVAYHIQQTRAAPGWRWAVQRGHNQVSVGEASSWAAAIYRAKLAINRLRSLSRRDLAGE